MITQKVEVLEETYKLVVRAVNFKKDKPIQNVNIKVFRLEKEPITLEQWAENLRNSSPFRRLMLSRNTDDNGYVTAELPEGAYEIQAEKYSLRACELKQNEEVVFVEPKKHWWQ